MINFPDIKYLGEYYNYIVGLFDRSGIVLNRTSLNKSVRTRSPAILEAKIFAPGVSGYPDETALPFDESIEKIPLLFFLIKLFLLGKEKVWRELFLQMVLSYALMKLYALVAEEGPIYLLTHITINAPMRISLSVSISKNYQPQTKSANPNTTSTPAQGQKYTSHVSPLTECSSSSKLTLSLNILYHFYFKIVHSCHPES
ncbi:hypothetical protein FJZ31_03610 [Candidatus Poribacteria bacterium]|nr:hypothetical protein [Candidatus Poribacteria bacterium]